MVTINRFLVFWSQTKANIPTNIDFLDILTLKYTQNSELRTTINDQQA